MQDTRLVFVDLETSGSTAAKDSIIEIGLVVMQKGKIINTFNSFVSFDKVLPPFITQLTGISNEMLANAPTFASLAPHLLQFFSNAIFVAHNVSFDYAFLKHAMLPYDKKFHLPTLCTVKLSRKFYPQFKHHNLQAIIDRLALAPIERHRALADANVIANFFTKLCDEFSAEVVWQTIEKDYLHAHHLHSLGINAIPKGSGVYTFLDAQNTPLYIGKSKHLKSRVKSHFAQMQNDKNEFTICTQTAKICIHPTAGELGALLYESQEIKVRMPIYNKALRKKQSLIFIEEIEVNKYLTMRIKNEQIENIGHKKILAICKSRQRAKELIYSEREIYSLCLNPALGKDCFYSHIGKCFGACTGKESPIQYNLRFKQAFSQTKIMAWPFSEAIVIRENDGALTDEHFFNEWIYLGTKHTNLGKETIFIPAVKMFDYDIYKILKNHIIRAHEIITSLPLANFFALKDSD